MQKVHGCYKGHVVYVESAMLGLDDDEQLGAEQQRASQAERTTYVNHIRLYLPAIINVATINAEVLLCSC